MTGLVNESDSVIQLLDEGLSGKSDVIPVTYKKDGSLSAVSQTVSKEDYDIISSFVNKKIRDYGKRILNGEIEVNPYEAGGRESCTYCEYRSICGFDPKIPGYKKRQLDMDETAAMEAIRAEIKE